MFLRSCVALTRFNFHRAVSHQSCLSCNGRSIRSVFRSETLSRRVDVSSRLVGATSLVARQYSGSDAGDEGAASLWTNDELQQVATKKTQVPLLPNHNCILNQVQVLLLTVNKNEFNATKSYLEPLKGHKSIYTYHHRVDSPHSTDTAIYDVGQYGACVAAVTKIDPGSALRTGVSFAPILAYHCFPCLAAIIGVGVICGVESKTKLCDVVVSSKVVNYDKARVENGGYISRGESLPASSYLQQIFSHANWPHTSKKIFNRLSGMPLPEIHHGTILSGPYFIDDAEFKDKLLKSFSPEAIGLEMEGSGLFAAAHETKIRCILVKSVCDFGDGNKNKIFQPTAAVIAADCVRHVLNNPQVPRMLSDTHQRETIERKVKDSIPKVSPQYNSLAAKLKSRYQNAHFICKADVWLPDQPKIYIPPLIMHYKEQSYTDVAITELKAKGSVKQTNCNSPYSQTVCQNIPSHAKNKITRDISDLTSQIENVATKSRIALIEGAPGIGKTSLLKEMAYQWAQGKLFTSTETLLLVQLQDPVVQNLNSLKELINLFCKRDDIVDQQDQIFNNHILKEGGKQVTFLLDDYDALPEHLRENSLISRIIQKQDLPEAAVVVSSIPNASRKLRDVAVCYADILGFTIDDQHSFIQESLKGNPKQAQKLTKYFSNPSISSLCHTPFNMTILTWLYKQGVSPPTTFTDLFNYFICYAIRHHPILRPPDNNFTDVKNLPDQYNEIIKGVSAFCLNSINKGQLLFNFEEVKTFCPSIENTSECFGLIQAAEHFTPKGTETKTQKFIHYPIQEFLAAYQISLLKFNPKIPLLVDNFWSDTHTNTFALYAGLTEGKEEAFKRFLTGDGSPGTNNKTISHDIKKCLRLFYCYFEAKDSQACDTVSKHFYNKERNTIDLSQNFSHPTSSDLQCLEYFFSRLPKKKLSCLDMHNCDIGDDGLKMLHKSLILSGIAVDEINLKYNSLTSQSSQEIADIVTFCKTRILDVSHNSLEVGLDLSNIMSLEELNISHSNMTSNGGIRLFSSLILNKNSQLRVLNTSFNCIGSETENHISTLLENNCILEELDVSSNKLSGGCSKICESLTKNNISNLKKFTVGEYAQAMTKMSLILVHNSTLENLRIIIKNAFPMKYSTLFSSLTHDSSYRLRMLTISGDMNSQILCDLSTSLKNNVTLEELQIFSDFRSIDGVSTLLTTLTNNRLRVLEIGGTSISDKVLLDISSFLAKNSTLEELYIYINDIGFTSGASILFSALAKNKDNNLRKLWLSSINHKVTPELTSFLTNNNVLEVLQISDKNCSVFSKSSARQVLQSLENNKTLRTLSLPNLCSYDHQTKRLQAMINKKRGNDPLLHIID